MFNNVRVYEPFWKMTPDIATFEVKDKDDVVVLSVGPNRNGQIPDAITTTESPKYKFSYTIEFFFSDQFMIDGEFPENLSESDYQGQHPLDNRIPALRVSRPQPTINYEKVNFYNFRTNVAKSVDFGTVNVVMYDDGKNKAFNVFNNYFKVISPITNIDHNSANTLDTLGLNLQTLQGGEDQDPTIPINTDNRHSASLGPLKGRRHGLIKRIRVTHFYKVDGVEKTIHYDYLNPKIVSAAIDELDHSQSGITLVDLTFNYDSFFTSEGSA